MKVKVRSGNPVHGRVNAPVSKSFAHRMLICAALADTPSRILCHGTNDDIDATVGCLEALGAVIKRSYPYFEVTPITKVNKERTLFCRESGSTLRFLLPVAAALHANARFDGEGRLPSRPLSPLYELMADNGVTLSEKNLFPLQCTGKLSGERFSIDGGVSSQFISGLLMACPVMSGRAVIEITGKMESTPYIDITIECMRAFGVEVIRRKNIITVSGAYRSFGDMCVEGDWSSAAFWLCAGVLSKESVSVSGLSGSSAQGDRAVLDVLKAMNGKITCEKGIFTAHPSSLEGCTVDCSHIPDLVPILSVCACFAKGKTVFESISRLRSKESDRVTAIRTLLSDFGVKTESDGDTLTVYPSMPKGDFVDSFSDHRIAMSGAVLALSCGCDAVIDNAECVSKSYPTFFEDLLLLTNDQ